MEDATIDNAVLDRLVNNAHRIGLQGPSSRPINSKNDGGDGKSGITYPVQCQVDLSVKIEFLSRPYHTSEKIGQDLGSLLLFAFSVSDTNIFFSATFNPCQASIPGNGAPVEET